MSKFRSSLVFLAMPLLAGCGQYASAYDPVTGISNCPVDSAYYNANTRLDVRCGPQSQPVSAGGLPTPTNPDRGDGEMLVYPAN